MSPESGLASKMPNGAPGGDVTVCGETKSSDLAMKHRLESIGK